MLKCIHNGFYLSIRLLYNIFRIFIISFTYTSAVLTIVFISVFLFIKYTSYNNAIYIVTAKYLKHRLDQKSIYLNDYKLKLDYKEGSYHLNLNNIKFYLYGIYGNLEHLSIQFNWKEIFLLNWSNLVRINIRNLNSYLNLDSMNNISLDKSDNNDQLYHYLIKILSKTVYIDLNNIEISSKNKKIFFQNINNLHDKLIVHNLIVSSWGEQKKYDIKDVVAIFKSYKQDILASFENNIHITKLLYINYNKDGYNEKYFSDIESILTETWGSVLQSKLSFKLLNYNKESYASLKYNCFFLKTQGANCNFQADNLLFNTKIKLPTFKEKFTAKGHIGSINAKVMIADLRNIQVIKNINYKISNSNINLLFKGLNDENRNSNIHINNAYGYFDDMSFINKFVRYTSHNITSSIEKVPVFVKLYYDHLASDTDKGNFKIIINSKKLSVTKGLVVWEFVNKILDRKLLTKINSIISLAATDGIADEFYLKLLLNKKDKKYFILNNDDLMINIALFNVKSNFLHHLNKGDNVIDEYAKNILVSVNASNVSINMKDISVNKNFIENSMISMNYREPLNISFIANNIKSASVDTYNLIKDVINVGLLHKLRFKEIPNSLTISDININTTIPLEIKNINKFYMQLWNNTELNISSNFIRNISSGNNITSKFVFVKKVNEKDANIENIIYKNNSITKKKETIFKFKTLINYGFQKENIKKNILFNFKDLSINYRNNININMNLLFKNKYLDKLLLESKLGDSSLKIVSKKNFKELYVKSDFIRINKVNTNKFIKYFNNIFTILPSNNLGNSYKNTFFSIVSYINDTIYKISSKKVNIDIDIKKIASFNNINLLNIKGFFNCEYKSLCTKGNLDFALNTDRLLEKNIYFKVKKAYAIVALTTYNNLKHIIVESENLGALLAAFDISTVFVSGSLLLKSKIENSNLYSSISILNLYKYKHLQSINTQNKLDTNVEKKNKYFIDKYFENFFISELFSKVSLVNFKILDINNMFVVFKGSSLYAEGAINILSGKTNIKGHYNVLYRVYSYLYNTPIIKYLLNKEKGIFRVNYKFNNNLYNKKWNID